MPVQVCFSAKELVPCQALGVVVTDSTRTPRSAHSRAHKLWLRVEVQVAMEINHATCSDLKNAPNSRIPRVTKSV